MASVALNKATSLNVSAQDAVRNRYVQGKRKHRDSVGKHRLEPETKLLRKLPDKTTSAPFRIETTSVKEPIVFIPSERDPHIEAKQVDDSTVASDRRPESRPTEESDATTSFKKYPLSFPPPSKIRFHKLAPSMTAGEWEAKKKQLLESRPENLPDAKMVTDWLHFALSQVITSHVAGVAVDSSFEHALQNGIGKPRFAIAWSSDGGKLKQFVLDVMVKMQSIQPCKLVLQTVKADAPVKTSSMNPAFVFLMY